MWDIARVSSDQAAELDGLRHIYAEEMGASRVPDLPFTLRLLNDPDVLVWGAYDGKRLIGFAIVMELPDAIFRMTYGMMDDLFVDPEFRGRGVAKALISDITLYGQVRGWAHLRWLVPRDDVAAISLYKKVAQPVELDSYIIRLVPERSY